MSNDGPPPRNSDTGVTNDEVELAQVLEWYLADLEAGRPADPEGLVAAHPALARPLRACLKVMHIAQGLDESVALRVGSLSVDDEGFRPVVPTGSSALTAIWPADDRPPSVLLPDPPEDDSPILRMQSRDESPLFGIDAGRYQILGEIARGGMGIVLKARDADLGRDLALKVLLDRHRGDQDVVRRFVEEAQIGGQLQHPGIVPVHELGSLADRRPFFAMMLVKGRTLASLLADRPGPVHELPRFLAIFESICQTIAYAHARRVIHRDLKPANVMVGNFGEVQVMDWGLAKVLAEGGIADEARAMQIAETAVLTVRSGSVGSGSESQAGSVLGTPAYMAPEQARGDVEQIDERADVFGLGAILLEILTSRPPYLGSTRDEIRDKAARGDLTDAIGRLTSCEADAELVSLARDCLAVERQQRPRNAGEVSRRLTAYLSGVQERLKSAELARVEAQTRAGKAQARATIERSRRLRTLALAASVLVTVGVIGGGWTYLMRERTARMMATNRVVTDALADAERLRGQAQSAAIGDLAKWSEVMGAARRARDLLAEGEGDDSLRGRVTTALLDLKREQVAAQERAAEVERDRMLLEQLEAIPGSRSEHWDPKQSDAEYAAAFRDFGIDLDQLDPSESGKRIGQRSAPVELAGYVDDWAMLRVMVRDSKDTESWRRLLATTHAADPHPWRVALRDQIGRDDRDGLRRLAANEKELEAQSPPSLVLLATALLRRDDRAPAERVLRQAWRLSPGDFWVNFALARVYETGSPLARSDERARFLSVAVAIRPRSFAAHVNLGNALTHQGKTGEALASFREAIRLKPDFAASHHSLGAFLCDEKHDYDGAITEFRTALRLEPGSALFHTDLGLALAGRKKYTEAVVEHRDALRLKPDFAEAHNNLGNALCGQRYFEQAIAEYQQAIRLKPDYAEAHNNLGNALHLQRKVAQSIAEYNQALRLKPDYAEAHTNLGNALVDQGKAEQAIVEHGEALRLKPDYAEAHTNLGNALMNCGKIDEAGAEFREALRLKPDLAEAHDGLGSFLGKHKHDINAAITEHRTAVRLNPELATAHCNLGVALAVKGEYAAAIAELREALRLEPNGAGFHESLGFGLEMQGKRMAAIAEYREALRLKPDDAGYHDRLGVALLGEGNLDEAVVELRESIRLEPDGHDGHNNLGNALFKQQKIEEAIAEFREALRHKPDHAEARCNLGNLLVQQGRFADALSELKRGHELGSKKPGWQYPSADWVRKTERLVELDHKLPGILRGQDMAADAAESLAFAVMCYNKKLHGASARLWAEAFQAQPKLADDMSVQNRYNAACAAALAGSGQGKDDPPLDDAAKTKWRKQALDWLKADLAAWSKISEAGPPHARQSITQTLQHWKTGTDLAGLRDPAALAKLPEDEQKACRALCADVDALLAKAQGTKSE